MRTITISTGKSFEINPLTGKAVRALDSMQRKDDSNTIDIIFETVKAAGIAEEEIDNMAFPDVMALSRAITAETYGIEDEVKN